MASAQHGENDPGTAPLLAHLRAFPVSADLQISAFCAATAHYRRASVATPFPSHLLKTSKGDKDYHACQQALQRLPSVTVLLGDSRQALQHVPAASQALLRWLLLPDNRRGNVFVPVHPEQFTQCMCSPKYVQPDRPASVLPDIRLAAEVPTVILQRVPDPSSMVSVGDGFARPVVAFHGTCFENLHSILNTGLLNVSATRATMQRNGAIFGQGIYLSTRFDVAFSFSKAAASWRHSCLGSSCRCLLVCEVDLAKLGADGGQMPPAQPQAVPPQGSAGGATAATGSDAVPLPESYLLVTRPDAIRLLYVLAYREHSAAGGRSGLIMHWPRVVVGLYLLFILMQWLLANKQLHMQLRRWWAQVVADGPDANVPAWQRWQ